MTDCEGTEIQLGDWVRVNGVSSFAWTVCLHVYGRVNMVSKEEIHIGNLHWINDYYNMGQSILAVTESPWVEIVSRNKKEREARMMMDMLESK